MYKRYLFSILILLFVLNISSQINSQALLFERIVNSPRAVGMGGVTANLVDAQSAIYNPGAYGLFSFDQSVSFSLPNKTSWLPEITDQLELKTWSFGIGHSNLKGHKRNNNKTYFAIGLSSSKKILDYGELFRTYPYSNSPESSHLNEEVNYYTLAVGIDFNIRVGFGFTHKTYNSISPYMIVAPDNQILYSEVEGSLYDIGFLVEFPLSKLFNTSSQDREQIQFEVTPSVSFVQANNGKPLVYLNNGAPVSFTNIITTEVPLYSKIGYGINAHYHKFNQTYFSFLFIYEREKDLVRNSDAYTRKGVELGLMNTLFMRFGEVRDFNYRESDYTSYGIGFSLRGFLTAFNSSNSNDSSSDVIGYIFKNIDVKFDWAKIDETRSALDNTKFMKLSITI